MLKALERIFLTIALIAGGYCAYVFWDANRYQASQEEWLRDSPVDERSTNRTL